ncbi:AAC(3) family N-acetyltransferase [Halorubrum pallidum]|uniref:AAC(3) family N-acetyltransferase n=1 Tax=Halorubrum pallidum TaxID=1526114 RepID=A0ABD5T6P2_9EURY
MVDRLPVDITGAVKPLDEMAFDELLSSFDADTVFVHVGLSDVNAAVDGNPYTFLYDTLIDNFESVLAPGFTPSFRSCGVYHKQFSKPEYGMFSKLFGADAEYRTNDAIHSILVDGNYRFDNCDHHDSFGPSGCWQQLEEDNVLYLNIGTDDFLATQLHYLEVALDLPYVTTPEHDGVVYYDVDDYEEITQSNYGYEYDYWLETFPNWSKIRRYLESTNAVTDHSTGGLTIYSFKARDIREALEPKLADDPYYLVT